MSSVCQVHVLHCIGLTEGKENPQTNKAVEASVLLSYKMAHRNVTMQMSEFPDIYMYYSMAYYKVLDCCTQLEPCLGGISGGCYGK